MKKVLMFVGIAFLSSTCFSCLTGQHGGRRAAMDLGAATPSYADDDWKAEVRQHLAKAESQAAYLDGVMDLAEIHARQTGLTHLVSDVRGHLDRAKGYLARTRTALDRGDRAEVARLSREAQTELQQFQAKAERLAGR